MKITWAPPDFQEIQSDAQRKPVRYTSQYLYNQGTGQVKRLVYQFLYSPDQRLNRVDVDGLSYIKYCYEGNQVTRAEEYSAAGMPITFHTYQYSASNQQTQTDVKYFVSKMVVRKTYLYDSRGNLSLLSEFARNPESGTYDLETTTTYTDYDNQKHVENLLATFPFLPDVTFQTNNYRTKIVRYKDGREISRETFAYAYNEQGYSRQKIRSGAGGTLTATYSY